MMLGACGTSHARTDLNVTPSSVSFTFAFHHVEVLPIRCIIFSFQTKSSCQVTCREEVCGKQTRLYLYLSSSQIVNFDQKNGAPFEIWAVKSATFIGSVLVVFISGSTRNLHAVPSVGVVPGRSLLNTCDAI